MPAEKYDLIWFTGLFDYLTDRLFTRLVRSLIPFLREGGGVVVGKAEVASEKIEVRWESEGVNLFVHIAV